MTIFSVLTHDNSCQRYEWRWKAIWVYIYMGIKYQVIVQRQISCVHVIFYEIRHVQQI